MPELESIEVKMSGPKSIQQRSVETPSMETLRVSVSSSKWSHRFEQTRNLCFSFPEHIFVEVPEISSFYIYWCSYSPGANLVPETLTIAIVFTSVNMLLFWFSASTNNSQLEVNWWKLAALQRKSPKHMIWHRRMFGTMALVNGKQVVFAHWNCWPLINCSVIELKSCAIDWTRSIETSRRQPLPRPIINMTSRKTDEYNSEWNAL